MFVHRSATAFAPASVGNVGIGFDILGHALKGAGDRVSVRLIAEPEVRITAIHGADRELPQAAADNTAGAALIALRESLGCAEGFAIEIHKGIPFGSGMGGSAASAVAALVAANGLLRQPLPLSALYPMALTGEEVASGSRHGDNVAPMLLGGLVLAVGERDPIKLSVPSGLYCAHAHPHCALETRRARAALQGAYALSEFVEQSGHLALFLTGLAQGDRALISAGLNDVLVEPRRAPLVPGFAQVKRAALEAGALGASISGAGPSVFAWCWGETNAQQVGRAMVAAFAAADLPADLLVGPVETDGAQLLNVGD